MIAAIALASALSRFVVLNVTIDAYGIAGTGTIVVDRQSGKFARRFSAGPASEQEGWDGTRAWRADATGMPRIQGNAGERGEILQWSSAFVKAIDASDHRTSIAGATDHVDVSFEGYRIIEGLALPTRIVARSQQNGVWTANLDKAAATSLADADSFAAPRPATPDYSLDHVTTIPVSMSIGSPGLDVRVNGQTLHFLLDTGGQNVITDDAVKRIGLQVEGHGAVAGGGGNTTSIEYATAKSVQVGAAKMFDQPFIVLPAASLPGVDGIVGYELLARFAARLDMMHGTLELAPSVAAFGASTGAEHFEYFDRQPQVEGSLDGVRGAFSIDTGSGLTAQVEAPAVVGQRLVQRMHATVTAYALDVGGRYPIYLVRARSLSLGSQTFADPLVDLIARQTPSDNASIVANVGDGILRRWILVFDYPHQMVDFRPGGDPAGNVVHDHSGMIVTPKPGGIIVAQVLGGTPASDAGVTEGARIVAIDGAALSPNDADRVRKILSGAPGTLVRVLFAGGVTRQFVLRAYL